MITKSLYSGYSNGIEIVNCSRSIVSRFIPTWMLLCFYNQLLVLDVCSKIKINLKSLTLLSLMNTFLASDQSLKCERKCQGRYNTVASLISQSSKRKAHETYSMKAYHYLTIKWPSINDMNFLSDSDKNKSL